MKNILNAFKKVSTPLPLIVLGLISLPSLAFGVFFYTLEETPHTSELAFIEHSQRAGVVGSVVPASCESAPPTNHFVGDCPIPQPPASLTATCSAAGDAVTLTWPASPGAVNYFVRMDYPGDPAPHLVQADYYVGNSIYVGVTPGTQYNAWVHAGNAVGESGGATYTAFTCPIPAIGAFDSVNADTCSVSGWAFDQDNPAASIAVHVYQDASAFAGGTFVASCPTNVLRADVNNYPPFAGYGLTGSHGFNCALPSSYAGTGSHSLYIHAIDLNVTGPHNVISASPRSLSCPAGILGASSCQIPLAGTSCNSSVDWQSAGFAGVSVQQGSAAPFSSAVSSAGTLRAVTPDNATFTLRDTGSSYVRTATAAVTCAGGGGWVGTSCEAAPLVTVTASPDVIRSGETASLSIGITANYDLTCTMNDGGAVQTFSHTAAASERTYTRTTRPLTSAQMVNITCASTLYPSMMSSSDVRVRVIPTVQEI